MSKTGRGILRGPGPYFCLYSPECVEEKFCELRRDGVLRSSPKSSHLADAPSSSCLLAWRCYLTQSGASTSSAPLWKEN
jgi:hypothetical protein